MNKQKLILPISILLGCLVFGGLFLPVQLLAVEGTCSSHGGVDCQAGPDTNDGSAICKDGWRDSSEFFGNALVCKDAYLCSNEQYQELVKQYGLETILMNINKKTDELLAKKTEYDAIESPIASYGRGTQATQKRMLSSEITSMANNIIALQDNYKRTRNIVYDACKILGGNVFYKLSALAIEIQGDYYKRIENDRQEKINQSLIALEQQNKNLIQPVNNMIISAPIIISEPVSGVLNISKSNVKIKYASFNSVYNVRQTAFTNSKIITTTKKNVKYKIVDLSKKDWIKIEINKKTGWVMKKFAKIY